MVVVVVVRITPSFSTKKEHRRKEKKTLSSLLSPVFRKGRASVRGFLGCVSVGCEIVMRLRVALPLGNITKSRRR
ncbi:hypothetical protein CABS01_07636 [Colletotrichum abscissum]|uniref:uncharacterized protein n=1 Tax=Colletotrichum abscissum TaxID=1671311 RepID=UPI0027D72EFC|nr:uncharacterized protein CABS01_07636 [Colletotrichum abscissum]KAK1511678.1 hypothetical protein CABS01_07636 [Colletotrichum abscissum]